MRILFEEYQYKPTQELLDILADIDPLQNTDYGITFSFVGYFYCPTIEDCVFILPKVLLEDKDDPYNPGHKIEALANYTSDKKERGLILPEDIFDPKGQDEYLSKKIGRYTYKDFLYEFAVWIYRTLCVYRKKVPDSKAISYKQMPQDGVGKRHHANTYLDIILSLIRFNKENQNFFMFTIKNIHSGMNKINWTKTISKNEAFIQNNMPIYLNPVNKKRKINFDEELFVIFFSVLNYINGKYGFRAPIPVQYELIKNNEFKRYLNGYGKIRLRQIKYKYFSDKALRLWELCYSFFDTTHRIAVNVEQKEYLLARSYFTVFESMIDELIGDNPLPDHMDKKQEDGKIVDHLYTDKSLIENENDLIYYIGDSKYYKVGHELTSESIYKQYTYARNAIQWNIDIWNDGNQPESGVRLLDRMTEGYNVIPNFFISAKMDEAFEYSNDGIDKTNRAKNKHKKVHFKNRLFDRDTLLLFHYDVNFLFVLSLYAKDNTAQKAAWKERIRERFRNEIREWLQQDYDFYAMKSRGNVLAGEQFIKDHFMELHGKLYRPYEDLSLYTFALEKQKDSDNTKSETYQLLNEFFEIKKINLGDNPKEELEAQVVTYQQSLDNSSTPISLLPQYHVEAYGDAIFVVGMYHDQAHWDWITGKNDKGTLIYNVRLGDRDGALKKTTLKKMKPKFAILYEEGHSDTYRVFRIHDTAVMDKERMKTAMYPNPQGDYFIFRFDEEITIGNYDITKLIEDHSKKDKGYVDGMPLFPKGEELLDYRK